MANDTMSDGLPGLAMMAFLMSESGYRARFRTDEEATTRMLTAFRKFINDKARVVMLRYIEPENPEPTDESEVEFDTRILGMLTLCTAIAGPIAEVQALRDELLGYMKAAAEKDNDELETMVVRLPPSETQGDPRMN